LEKQFNEINFEIGKLRSKLQSARDLYQERDKQMILFVKRYKLSAFDTTEFSAEQAKKFLESCSQMLHQLKSKIIQLKQELNKETEKLMEVLDKLKEEQHISKQKVTQFQQDIEENKKKNL